MLKESAALAKACTVYEKNLASLQNALTVRRGWAGGCWPRRRHAPPALRWPRGSIGALPSFWPWHGLAAARPAECLLHGCLSTTRHPCPSRRAPVPPPLARTRPTAGRV